ncbi:hypothetical protein ACWPM1_04870 [Tsuneonella sp. HG249]
MRNFLIGAAAIAMAATGAIADPGKGGGGDKGSGKEHAGMNHGGGKPAKGPAMREAKAERGPAVREAKAAKPDRGPSMSAERKADRGNEARADKGDNRGGGQFKEDRQERRVDRDVRIDRQVDHFDDDGVRIRDVRRVAFDDGRRGLIDGCPPGLAKKNNGCMPPGLAKQRGFDGRNPYYQPSWWGYDRLGDGRYFYDDGYLFRMGSNNSVLGYIPLLGGALSVGNPWPSYYQPVSVPDYYVDYYNLGPDNGYRYADDVLYRVDPQSGVIDSIAALLTGDSFAVGQPLPRGYDVYNVPYGYQDRYYDSVDANYRYADGYVYQVDPQTQLIQAIIELLV